MASEILISYDAYRKIFAYAEAAKKHNDSEVGGFLQIIELDEGGLLVEDIILPEQTATGGSFTVKNGKWMKELKAEQIPKMKGWWHSHHNMGTFHSGTDDNTLGDKWDSESKNGCPYGLSIVVAFPNKMQGYLQYYRPIKTKPFEVEVSVVYPQSDEIYKHCEEEVKAKVKKWTYEAYNKGDEAADFFFKQRSKNTPTQIVTETGTAFKKKEEETLLKLSHKIIDPLTGLSVWQMIDNGTWDPELYPDLEEELEDLLEVELGANWGEENGFGDDKETQLKEGQCTRLFRNEKDRLICCVHGKNYNCTGCKYNLQDVTKTETKESEEKSAIVPLGNVP